MTAPSSTCIAVKVMTPGQNAGIRMHRMQDIPSTAVRQMQAASIPYEATL